MEKSGKIKIISKGGPKAVKSKKGRKENVKLKVGFQDEDMYDRTKRITWIDIDTVKKADVLVIGAGAVGNEVMKNLVLSGFKNITVIDMDHVVLSNLSRCLFFTKEDVESKKYKVDIVAEHIKPMAPDAKITPIAKPIEELSEEFFKKFDVIFGCVDNILARVRINSIASHYHIPYVDGGTHGMLGKVQVVLPPETPCIECNMNVSHYKNLEQLFTCSGREDTTVIEPKIPAEITTTAVIAAIIVREGLKIVCGKTENVIKNLFYYDGFTNKAEILQLEVSPQCNNHH